MFETFSRKIAIPNGIVLFVNATNNNNIIHRRWILVFVPPSSLLIKIYWLLVISSLFCVCMCALILLGVQAQKVHTSAQCKSMIAVNDRRPHIFIYLCICMCMKFHQFHDASETFVCYSTWSKLASYLCQYLWQWLSWLSFSWHFGCSRRKWNGTEPARNKYDKLLATIKSKMLELDSILVCLTFVPYSHLHSYIPSKAYTALRSLRSLFSNSLNSHCHALSIHTCMCECVSVVHSGKKIV